MKTWEINRLRDICSFDKTPNKANLPYVGLEDIESGTGKFLGAKVPKKVESNTFSFHPRHLLYGRLRPYLNKSLLPDFVGHCSTEIFPILPSAGLDRKFLFYWMTKADVVKRIDATCTGARMPRANMDAVLDFAFPLPPLPEQRRIVAILDEAFGGLAIATANTEKNLENAREVLDSQRRKVFDDLVSAGGIVDLGSICSFENGDRGKNYPGKEHRVARGVPFINAGHLTERGLEFDSMDYISEERFALLGSGKVKPLDILFCLRGSLGKFASVGKLSQGAIASSLVILRPKPDLLHAYLMQFLSSKHCSDQIDKLKGGAAQPNLGAKDLKQFRLPLPSLAIQEAVVSELETVSENVRELISGYVSKLAAIAELKQSLLQKAFVGDLTKNFRTEVDALSA